MLIEVIPGSVVYHPMAVDDIQCDRLSASKKDDNILIKKACQFYGWPG